MIYFITNKDFYKYKINTSLFDDIIIFNEKEGIELFNNELNKDFKFLPLDTENSGLDYYRCNFFLLGIEILDNHFIFDNSCNLHTILSSIGSSDKTLIGNNLKYDIGVLYAKTNILLLNKVFDTMIAEQRVYMGLMYSPTDNPLGRKAGLKDLIDRYTNNTISKDDRQEFIDKDKDLVIQPNHLYYLRNDLSSLIQIMTKQQEIINKYKMNRLLHSIEFPLIKIISLAEATGFTLNTDKWKEQIVINEKIKYDVLIELDNIIIDKRKSLSLDKKRLISGGKWETTREFQSIGTLLNQNDLFGNPIKDSFYNKNKNFKLKEYEYNINYVKTTIVNICKAFNCPLPTIYQTYSIPDKEATHFFSIKENELAKMLEELNTISLRSFLSLFIKLQKVNKSLSTYGNSFLNNINEITNRIHTQFRQCATTTGRMASGGGKKEKDKYNAQNIPRAGLYRECFEGGEDYLIYTGDITGAELEIILYKSKDKNLAEMSKGDMHSIIATAVWRAVYSKRYEENKENYNDIAIVNDILKQETERYRNLASNYICSKEKTPEDRNNIKPMGFGVIYGMYSAKAMQTLKLLDKKEGQICINVIKRLIPDAIKCVETYQNYAEDNGFVIHNQRTNSRRWFPNLLKMLKGEITKDTHFIEISKDLSTARNSPIQGTQADFIKEASVVLFEYFYINLIDATILGWVHDEFIIRIHKSLIDKKFIYKDKEYFIKEVIDRIIIDTIYLYLEKDIKIESKIEKYWKK